MITRRLARPLGLGASASWTCPACTRTSLLKRIAPIQQQRRGLQSVPPLAYQDEFSISGVPGLYSKEGFDLSWTQYQTLLVDKLNELTAGEPIENTPAKNLAIIFARDPQNASLFNHASAAHNNHAFFNTLSLAPNPLSKSPQLQESLTRTFGSIETLRMTMLDTAAAMFGPGYVWLVWARDAANANRSSITNASRGNWRILTTYLAGTPYSEAGYRQQGIDMATNNSSSYQRYLDEQHLQPANRVGAFGAFSQGARENAKFPPGGTSVMPVLCVSTWEHSYIYDYGLKGKRRFLDDWWNVIDWGVVDHMVPSEAKQVYAFERI